jgi:hypothetical protein
MGWRFALSMCASFVGGAIVAWTVLHGTERAPPPARATEVARPDAGRVGSVVAPAPSCDEAVAECEHVRDFYRAQLVVYEGAPQPWPVDVPETFRETQLRDTLVRSLDGVASVNELDCEEYPCIALVALTSDDQPCCTQIYERLPDYKIGGVKFYQTEDGRMVAAVALGAPERWNADVDTRAKWRMEQMVEGAQSR